MMENSYFWVSKVEKLLIKSENGKQSGSEYMVQWLSLTVQSHLAGVLRNCYCNFLVVETTGYQTQKAGRGGEMIEPPTPFLMCIRKELFVLFFDLFV